MPSAVPARIFSVALLVSVRCCPAFAGPDTSWERKTVLLTRPGVMLQIADGEKIAPKTAGVAKDVTFQVLKDEGGRLRIGSRRQEGWIDKKDAVLFADAVAFFTKQAAGDPMDSYALIARGVALSSKGEADKARADFDQAIRLDPKATLAYYHRANLAYGKAEYDGALDDYNTVIRLDPQFDWVASTSSSRVRPARGRLFCTSRSAIAVKG